MRNEESASRSLLTHIKTLPEFNFDDLSPLRINRNYLKIILSRQLKNRKVIRLKKGLYVSEEYIQKIKNLGQLSSYTEFIANSLHQPSYLSLDYVLSQHEILTGLPFNFTSISHKKTLSLSNDFGNFFYHKVKEKLFTGFKVEKDGDWFVFKATKAKALFDYFYLRKNHLLDKTSLRALRLNLHNFNQADRKEFLQYLRLENSKKMTLITHWLFD